MIEATGETIIGIEYPLKTTQGLHWRALLRPHGGSGERVRRVLLRDMSQLWQAFDVHGVATFSYDTRAQAAQAATIE